MMTGPDLDAIGRKVAAPIINNAARLKDAETRVADMREQAAKLVECCTPLIALGDKHDLTAALVQAVDERPVIAAAIRALPLDTGGSISRD